MYDIIEQGRQDERQRIETGLAIARAFIASTSEGKMKLHIDRYGDVQLEVEVRRVNQYTADDHKCQVREVR